MSRGASTRSGSRTISSQLQPCAFIGPTADDQQNGHILEAGFDRFEWFRKPLRRSRGFPSFWHRAYGRIRPVPRSRLNWGPSGGGHGRGHGCVGRVVMNGMRTSGGRLALQHELPSGTYVVRATTAKARSTSAACGDRSLSLLLLFLALRTCRNSPSQGAPHRAHHPRPSPR